MALLDFISTSARPDKSTATTPSQNQTVPGAATKKPTEVPTATAPHSDDPAATKSASSPPTSDDPKPVPQAHESEVPPVAGQSDSATRIGPSTDANRRWSFQGPFKLLRKPTVPRSTVEKHDAAAPTAAATDAASTATDRRAKLPSALSHASDRRAKQSALMVRSFIVGQDTDEGGVASPQVPISSAQLKSVKAQLSKPKTANKVIAHLRALPSFPDSPPHASQPIQAVCLPYSDEEADAKRFGTLRNVKPPPATTTDTPSTSPKESISIDAIMDTFKNIRIVNLFTAPDLGLGEPGDGDGILAGALPSAETVLDGFTQITPQLMALGYTAGKSLVPNHKGIYPPTDRLSVLTCTSLVHYHVAEISNDCYVDWWGLEILLPPPTLAYLSVSFICSFFGFTNNWKLPKKQRVHSISGTIMNVLTGLGVMYEGVREILPFVRYFSQYINFEFSTIKAQDRGKGVICAATW